jgi:hypothetical protein
MNNTTTPKILTSKQYSDFAFFKQNRPIRTSIAKYKRLKTSMQKHGWIPSFPATVNVIGNKKFLVDGQNRFTAAKELGLPIVYVVVGKKYNIAEIAESFRPWSGSDFASSHAADGNKNFQLLMEFCDKHGISPTRGVSLLAAQDRVLTDGSGGSSKAVREGTFKFEEKGAIYAANVLKVASEMPRKLKKNRAIIAAVSRVLLVEEVECQTLIEKIRTNLGQIVPKSSVDEYIHLLETIYNKRNKNPIAIGLKLLEKSRKA